MNKMLQGTPVIKYKHFLIEPYSRTVKLRGEKIINLYPKEFDVLKMLAEHPRWVFTKEQIYNEVYQEEIEDIDNRIYCIICGIRRKLKTSISDWNYIQTVHSIGYKFVIPDE